MKKLACALLCPILVLGLTACGAGGAEEGPEGPGAGIRVGVVMPLSGLGDEAICDMVLDGMTRAREDLGISFHYVEPEAASDFYPGYRMYAETGEYDLIIGLLEDQLDAVEEISLEFPDQRISLVDVDYPRNNVSSICTNWEEQTFLSGVLAGLGTMYGMERAGDSNTVGIVLAEETTTLLRGAVGFEAGVRYVNPDCTVLVSTVGSFISPTAAKQMGTSLYDRGAGFIQCLAGGSGLGVIEAAGYADRYVIGLGTNQNHIDPEHVVGSSMRRLDQLVYNEVLAVVEGRWSPGTHVSGMADGVVGLVTEGSDVVIPDDIQAILDEIRGRVVAGELVPCGERDELEDWLAANQYWE